MDYRRASDLTITLGPPAKAGRTRPVLERLPEMLAMSLNEQRYIARWLGRNVDLHTLVHLHRGAWKCEFAKIVSSEAVTRNEPEQLKRFLDTQDDRAINAALIRLPESGVGEGTAHMEMLLFLLPLARDRRLMARAGRAVVTALTEGLTPASCQAATDCLRLVLCHVSVDELLRQMGREYTPGDRQDEFKILARFLEAAVKDPAFVARQAALPRVRAGKWLRDLPAQGHGCRSFLLALALDANTLPVAAHATSSLRL